MQLEKVIGKVKTKKYGTRIIELMRSHTNPGTDGAEAGAKKRRRTDKDVVCVESSEEE